LILGASARAAASSARRAGLKPIAVDLFADRDLREIGPAQRIAAASYPEGVADAADAVPVAPWIYTGALENHPELVDRIARHRPLWGNDAPTLRAVRDPFAVAATLRQAGVRCPAVRADPKGLPLDGSWLVKPLASAGGRGIVPLGKGDAGAVSPLCYYQERIAGTSLSALFVAGRGDATLAGVTRQCIGRRDSPFAYTGSLGPWPISPRVRARIEAIGRALAAGFGLVGLVGVDLILREGMPWPVEVNPRYTASVEVLELALGHSLLADHARACDPDAAARSVPITPRPCSRPSVVGKSIVFAPTRCRFPGSDDPVATADDAFAIPRVADVPDAGTCFEVGEPVLTLIAGGRSMAACRLRLERRRARWVRRLRQSSY
jgi:predicted ATP-grasp superfamily ATP-dependent carboligase